MNAQIEQKCRDILADVLGLPAAQIARDRPLHSFGIDSIKMMEILMALEAEFGELPLERAMACQNLEDLAALIASR